MTKQPTSYDQDFYEWSQEQAALIRAGQWTAVDIEHVAEEIESLGTRDRRELINRLALLLAHLLKWHYQPERRCTGWRLTINEQRRQLTLLLEDSPSLKARFGEFLPRAYRNGTRAALEATGFLRSPFPADCPYRAEDILDEGFWPES